MSSASCRRDSQRVVLKRLSVLLGPVPAVPGRVPVVLGPVLVGFTLAMMALVAAGPAVTDDGAAQAPVAAESVNLIATQSIAGELIPCDTCKFGAGGLPRRAAFIQSCRDTADHVVVVDAGNFRRPGEQADLQHDRFQLEEMVAMGYQVFGVGEHDLRHGIDALRELFAGIEAPLVSANILDAASGEPVFAPYQILRVGPIRIGFTGCLGVAAWEEYQAAVPEVRVGDPLAIMPAVLAEMQPLCDLVVCFCQIHQIRLRGVLQALEGIDIAVAARRPKPQWYPRRLDTVEQVFYSSFSGKMVCWSRIEAYPGRAVLYGGKVHHMTFGIDEDAEVRRRVYEFLGQEDPGGLPGLTPQ